MKKILPFIVAFLISNTLFGQLPLTNLVAWYPFCDNYNDQSPAGLYQLIGSGTTFTQDRFTNAQGSLNFNGASSAYFPVPFFNAFSFSSADFTYSCWFYAIGAQSSIIWYNGDPQTNGYGIYMNNGTLGTAGTNVEVVFGGAIGQFASTPVTLSAWHHVLLAKNGGGYTLFVDGVPVPFTPLIAFSTPTVGQFTVGQDYTTGNSAFNGYIDDIAIYSALLNTAQITAVNNFNPDVAPFNFGNASNDTTICTNTITLIPSIPYDTSYSYLWSTGSTTTSVTVTPPASPGQNYSLTITQHYGCTTTESIDVSHLYVTIGIGPRYPAPFCTDSSITLSAQAGVGETYLWSTGATTQAITVGTAGPGQYTYWVTVDSAGGCTGVDTTTITVDSAVIVTLGPDTSSCKGVPVIISSSYGHAAGVTYQWGWENSSTGITGVTNAQTYTVTTSGTYFLTETIGVCKGSDTQTVNIVFDTMSIITPDTSICKGGSVQIRGSGNPFASFQWLPTAGLSSSNSVNPIITPDTSAWYKISASLLGCTAEDSLYIDVQPKPTVYIGGNRSVCKGDTIHITATVTPSWYTHYIYNWSPGTNLDNSGTTLGDSVVSTVVFTAGDSTDLIIIVKTPLDSIGRSCRAVDSAEIMVHTPHQTILRDTSICPGDSLVLNPNPIPGDSYAWHSGMYLSDSNAVHPVAKPITNIDYFTRSTDQYGCFDTATEHVTVYPGAVIDLGDSVTLYPGESYQISPQTNCVFFFWRPPLGLSDTAIANPVATPTVNTKYIVTAATEWGCIVTDSININVDPTSIVAVPNAFTPGGSVNNYLYVLKRGSVVLNHFRIFNRWGNKVYESSNIDAGWDGNYNGKPQPFDVYVYDLQAVTNEGVIFEKTGNVTLIR